MYPDTIARACIALILINVSITVEFIEGNQENIILMIEHYFINYI